MRQDPLDHRRVLNRRNDHHPPRHRGHERTSVSNARRMRSAQARYCGRARSGFASARCSSAGGEGREGSPRVRRVRPLPGATAHSAPGRHDNRYGCAMAGRMRHRLLFRPALSSVSSPGTGRAVEVTQESGRDSSSWGRPVFFMGCEPVAVSGRPTTHPDAPRVRIGSCRESPSAGL